MEWLKRETEEQKKRTVAVNQLSIVPIFGANGIGGGYNQLLDSTSLISMNPHGF
ncbi:hypothetical protein Hanom_Chr08g00710351 [Helianthus anomalus]